MNTKYNKKKAYYKISWRDSIVFRIDNLKFVINFYRNEVTYDNCLKKAYTKKPIGNKLFKHIIKTSNFISLRDNLSQYVYDVFDGVEQELPEKSIPIVEKMRKVLKDFKFDGPEIKYEIEDRLYKQIFE